MTLIELMTAIALFLMFVFALVPAVQPALDVLEVAETDNKFANSTDFVQETFETACAEGVLAMDDWENTMLHIEGISKITVTSVHQKTDYQLFRADCLLYGQSISILGIHKL